MQRKKGKRINQKEIHFFLLFVVSSFSLIAAVYKGQLDYSCFLHFTSKYLNMENKFKTSEMSTEELLRALDTAREDMEIYELQRTLEINTTAPQKT
jgi:hypothetical protein